MSLAFESALKLLCADPIFVRTGSNTGNRHIDGSFLSASTRCFAAGSFITAARGDWHAEPDFDGPEVLAPAGHLVNGTTIAQTEDHEVTYVHLLFYGHHDNDPENPFVPTRLTASDFAAHPAGTRRSKTGRIEGGVKSRVMT